MRMERYRWEPAQPITRDYIYDFASVASLYEHNPWNESSDRERAAWLDLEARPQADREGLVRTLIAYNEKIGNTDRALRSIEELRDPETLVVTGGQQAGLFTGPLLVLYKAITVITEARKSAERLGRKVVPVFWIAGEDHDLEEANHTFVLSETLTVQKIKLNESSDKKTSVSRWSIDPESWEDAVAQLEQTLMNTEFKPELIDRLKSICAASDTLTDQFARTLAWLFREYGLVLVDSDDPGLRKLEADMFRSIVSRQSELNRSLLEAKSGLEGLGYTAQVELNEGQAHLFVFHEGERLLLTRQGEKFTDRKGTVSFTEGELLELAAHSPERLSNNVMTRPLMQDYLFPVLSVVLGPSEMAYWGLLRNAFALFGLQMPILVPRYEFTLLEGTIQKQMAKFGLEFEDVIRRLDEKQNAWLEAQGSLQVEELFTDAKAKFAQLYGPVVEAVSGINPGLRKLGETNMLKIVEQIDFLEARAGDAFRSQHESALRHWERIRMSVMPLGKPQERVYNVFQYWVKYGGGWLRELMDMPLSRDGSHRIVYF
ncbi:bacillithiol biosynthesis cysteine-adding enzyme BshC [Paenibacillus mesophilus]|uniref:bacillithiol biosynthesis cysteine-adding enzyme BshC n=1 Tax=Paenibacillus mesophilus TaxID=2582849 RepID=UPI00110D9AC3|nr:bacillithiol biosynthesis cysteine-adding enzyme BshC [Paenibacillus mesophilus]TMV46676.1 bacillithiol biosynthesis cysteine-adding enzyme BshC [Paenibacillus mesophilus]